MPRILVWTLSIFVAGCGLDTNERPPLPAFFTEHLSKLHEEAISIKDLTLGAPYYDISQLIDENSCGGDVRFKVAIYCDGKRQVRVGGEEFDIFLTFWNGSSGWGNMDDFYLTNARFETPFGSHVLDTIVEKFGPNYSVSEKTHGEKIDGIWHPSFKSWEWVFPSGASLEFRVNEPGLPGEDSSIYLSSGLGEEMFSLRKKLKLEDI